MPSTTTTLAPVTVTCRRPNLRTGKTETWAVETVDGLWRAERIEASGTPWELVHVPSGLPAGLYGSLRKVRRAIADNSAARQMRYDADWERSRADHATNPETAERHRQRADALDAAALSLVTAA